MNYLIGILTALNVFPQVDLRLDDKYTAILSEQLKFVKTKTYDIVYPEMKARKLIPVNNTADNGAESISYLQWDGFGIAQIIANYADDIPMVEVLAEEFTQKVHGISLGYSYTIQELRNAAFANTPLSSIKARFTRRGFEQKVENIGAAGDDAAGLLGIANNPNVTLVTPINGSWTAGVTTGDKMVADLLYFESQIVAVNQETFEPDTLVLPITKLNLLKSTRISSTGDTHTTALQAFLASASYVKEVVGWNKLKTADAAGTGPRAICYAKNPDVLEYEIPQEFEQFPPQQKNFSFMVPTHGRVAGVVVRYPIGMAYMDGL